MQNVEVLKFQQHSFVIVRKQQRRSLMIKLHPDKPNQVLANKTVSQKVIHDFLLSKASWIDKNLKKIEEYRATYKLPAFKEGEEFPFFGEMKYFALARTKNKKMRFQVEEGFLICYVPDDKPEWVSDFEKMQVELISFYKKEALKYLVFRGWELSQLTGLKPSDIKIQTARTRWGSCNSQKIINLNWKLIVFAYRLIDYVIIHELCHLRHLDHSDAFWNLVAQHCPNYQDIQVSLKQQTTQAAFLDRAI